MAKEKQTQEKEVQEVGNKYIVGDKSYLFKNEKVYKTGEEIFLTPDELENVKHLVISLEADPQEQE